MPGTAPWVIFTSALQGKEVILLIDEEIEAQGGAVVQLGLGQESRVVL